MAILFYVGCYTDDANSLGLRAVEVEPSTGSLTLKASYAADNPLYLTKTADGRYLYVHQGSGLASYAIGDAGKLTPVDTFAIGGKAMCHVALTPDERHLTWAAYTSAEAGVVRVQNGRFLEKVRHDRHVGKGVNLPRQAGAHCHMSEPTPDGAHYVVVDLGLDQLVTYPVNAQGEGNVCRTQPAGAGPRHVLFHPNGKLAFVTFELGSRLTSYAWNLTDGFRKLDTVLTMPPTWKGMNYDSAIRFSPDGRRVIVSNRGYDALTTYDYDVETGKLVQAGQSMLPGSWPRDFAFVPGSDLAIVAMERSGTLLVVKYDAAQGTFTPINSLHGFHRPVAIRF